MAHVSKCFRSKSGTHPPQARIDEHRSVATFILRSRDRGDATMHTDRVQLLWAVDHLNGQWESELMEHFCPNTSCCASRKVALEQTLTAVDILCFRFVPKTVTLGRFNGTKDLGAIEAA